MFSFNYMLAEAVRKKWIFNISIWKVFLLYAFVFCFLLSQPNILYKILFICNANENAQIIDHE